MISEMRSGDIRIRGGKKQIRSELTEVRMSSERFMSVIRYQNVFRLSRKAMPVGVAARPPLPVSFRSSGSIRPTLRMASNTSSGGIRAADAGACQVGGSQGVDRADDIALDTGDFHQAGNRVAGETQQIFMAMAAAWEMASASPPRRNATPPAAMAEAAPISA